MVYVNKYFNFKKEENNLQWSIKSPLCNEMTEDNIISEPNLTETSILCDLIQRC